MNPDLKRLQPYPFEKLNKLFAEVTPPTHLAEIPLTIGEPKHQPPQAVLTAIKENLQGVASYPLTKGVVELRQAIANWCQRRFSVDICAETQVLPVNGTREALFAFAQTIVDASAKNPLVVSPNPFYQIYEGAAFLAGATPHFVPVNQQLLADYASVPDAVWQDCQLLYLCSPGNPTGAVISLEELEQLIQLADKHDFVIAADECYAEIYWDQNQAPVSLLGACKKLGRNDYKRCVIFHSLSKRSNLPGLRSGFVAGDAELLAAFLKYRTYHGCAMSPVVQQASITAWDDQQHVEENQALYAAKFAAVDKILGEVLDYELPSASFYLWPKTPINEEEFTQRLYAEQGVKVLPGSYLSRTVDGQNPGAGRVRISLVASLEQCEEAALRIREFVLSLS